MEVNAQMANVSSEQENIQMFYREQNELLFRYAMLLTGDRHQAEEALQTAWCQCLTYRETFFRVRPGCGRWCVMLFTRSIRKRATLSP